MHWIFGGIFHRFPELPLCNSLWYFASETLLALVSLDSCPLREFLKFGHFLHLGCAMAWSFKIVSWGNHELTLFSEFQGSLSIIVWFLKTIVTRVMCKFFFFFLKFQWETRAYYTVLPGSTSPPIFSFFQKKLHNVVCSSRSASFFVIWLHHDVVSMLIT